MPKPDAKSGAGMPTPRRHGGASFDHAIHRFMRVCRQRGVFPGETEGEVKVIAPRRRAVSARFVACGMLALAAEAAANVNLEWRVSAPIVRVRGTVEAGLYAVSDDDSSQPFVALDAIVSWDPGALELEGKVDSQAYTWLLSGFPDDSQIDGLNADCGPQVFCDLYTYMPYNDGDALYVALGQFFPGLEPVATPEGLLVTTILFTALTVTPATELSFLATAGDFSSTRVVHADQEGTGNVTGKLGSLTISIAPCGSAGDFDGDCMVDLMEVDRFGGCLTGPGAASLEPECAEADFDGDGDADLRDIAALQLMFTGS